MPHSYQKLICDLQVILENALEAFISKNHTESYKLYERILNEAVKLGYNSTIICPKMNDDVEAWAQFQAVLINEITHFTNMAETPACLISAGQLSSQDGHQDFAFQLLSNIRDQHPLALASLSLGSGKGLFATNQNTAQLNEQELKEHIVASDSVINVKQMSQLPIDLRIVLLG
jgi:hypothetical protein